MDDVLLISLAITCGRWTCNKHCSVAVYPTAAQSICPRRIHGNSRYQ